MWFDNPDEVRKSHDIAKPTSSGIAFMLPIVMTDVVLSNFSIFSSPIYIASIITLLLVGAYDDFRNLSVKIRLIIISLVSLSIVSLFFDYEKSGFILMAVYFIGVIWWMNLFNFMDGADGMAVLHSVVTLLGYSLYFLLFSQIDVTILLYLLFIIACLMAFLFFNFPRAHMFMGDSGSLSLSFLIATVALYGISNNYFDEFIVIAFHLVFIIDTTLTLLARIRFKQSLTQAHNLHMYQALIVSGKSHAKISLYYALTSSFIIAITLFLKYLGVSHAVMLYFLLGQAIVLSVFWYKFHNKTKFERFIR